MGAAGVQKWIGGTDAGAVGGWGCGINFLEPPFTP